MGRVPTQALELRGEEPVHEGPELRAGLLRIEPVLDGAEASHQLSKDGVVLLAPEAGAELEEGRHLALGGADERPFVPEKRNPLGAGERAEAFAQPCE